MPNVQNPPPAQTPLLPPGQLWKPSEPVKPAVTPSPPSPALTHSPDQLRQLMSHKMPPIGAVPLVETPPTDLRGQLGSLQTLLQKADAQTLAPYGVTVQSNAQGQISGYLIQGKPATAEQVQQHLLPLAGRLHKELMQARTTVTQEYTQFIQRAQTQAAQMTPVERNAVKIQLQAIQSVYQGFLNRITQVDNLIK
jgi:hypothetical protein